ncbi:Putative metal-dependent hydrolase, composite domain superfamily [Septoria linicola]|uniref:Metal-dependent hydrolase, composite domain superfamily n=1 Tax=Septoria linicola TaxID=215465 RepID=A0A9Q9AKM9_9PEZI|nr:putative metal-dependent hydrolase, composite domain superfamily [Septoria linicola]USW50780.1 Putative metal-dependent hydrolase, composite domain superfamily [Septoria linicola]
MTRNSSIAPLPNSVASSYTRVDADLLIPGRGQPIHHASLIFEPGETSDDRGKILFAGQESEIPAEFLNLQTSLSVPVLMPGMWDCHVHFFGESEPDMDHLAVLSPALAGLRSARDITATLNAGFTSVREVGGYGIDLLPAISEGAPLSQTVGHGDLHTVPLELVHLRMQGVDAGGCSFPIALADGVEEAIKQTRKQIRRGAKLIKVCATGGVMSKIDSPRAAQFTNAELEAIVGEATRTGMIVAAHAHGTEGILAALHAGVKTIEHGSYLTEEAIALMEEKDAMLIATRFIQQNGLDHPNNIPPSSYAKLLEIVDVNEKSYQAAIRAGIKCALGTDLGISSISSEFNHGMNGREFFYAVEAGMSPLQAIEAGTANGPDTLGPQAPLSGQLKEGYDADFIALEKSPLEDVSVLGRSEEVKWVWKGGRIVKREGRPINMLS